MLLAPSSLINRKFSCVNCSYLTFFCLALNDNCQGYQSWVIAYSHLTANNPAIEHTGQFHQSSDPSSDQATTGTNFSRHNLQLMWQICILLYLQVGSTRQGQKVFAITISLCMVELVLGGIYRSVWHQIFGNAHSERLSLPVRKCARAAIDTCVTLIIRTHLLHLHCVQLRTCVF